MQAQEARQAACPACNTRFEIPSDELEVVCPACMNAFTVHARASVGQGLPAIMEFEVKGPNGETMGQMDRHHIRQAIYAGRLRGREELRGEDGWEPIAERPEFAEVFQLVGIDIGSLRISQQQIRGWRKATPARKPTQRPNAPQPAAPANVAPLPPPEKPPLPVKYIAMGVGVLLFVVIGGAVIFSLL